MGNIGVKLTDRPYFQYFLTRKQDGFYIGRPVLSRTTGTWLISAARGVYNMRGDLQYVVTGAVEPPYFDKLWQGVNLGAGSSVTLFHRDGTLMMRSPATGLELGKSYKGLGVYKYWDADHQLGTYSSPSLIDGVRRIFSFRQLASQPDLLVVVGQSEEIALAQWRRLVVFVSLAWAFGSLAVTVLTIALLRVWRTYLAAQSVAVTQAQRLKLATDSGAFGVWDYDVIAGTLLWDPWMYRLYGLEPSDSTETYELWSSHLHPENKSATEAALQDGISSVRPYDTEYRIVWRDGSVHHLRATARVTRDQQGKALRMVGLNWDITERKAQQQQLEHIAHYDALTKLPNRVLLADRLQQAMAQCQRRGKMLAVAYLDIDGFKAINDRRGHTVGDQFLIELALLMKRALREGDTLARLGGDEFVAILVDLDQAQDCEPVLQRLLEAASTPISLSEVVHKVSASIGVTLYPQDDADADQLLRHADQAMYVAKEDGKNRYRMFDVVQDSASKKHRESLESIRSAIDHNEFVLYYQPKVNIKTGLVVGTEALIRWQHPQRGLLAPGLFLPMIEGQDISVELGEWVIHTALRQISAWRATGLEMSVSVNVGARQLQSREFVSKLSKALASQPDMRRGQLELEIVETSALEDVAQVSALMQTCLGLGVGFALDDFGTGYSSLTYLKRLPAGLLKIDQGFVRDMLIDPDDLAIVHGVIGLARVFKREVIAEGVETEAHASKLLELGCELAQGYGIARPMPAADMPAWVKGWHAKAVWTA